MLNVLLLCQFEIDYYHLGLKDISHHNVYGQVQIICLELDVYLYQKYYLHQIEIRLFQFPPLPHVEMCLENLDHHIQHVNQVGTNSLI